MKKIWYFLQDIKSGSPAQLGLKTPELPDGFQQVVFKGQMREGHLGLWDQLVHNSLNG